MADLPQQNTIVQYLADGVEDQYVFPFFVPLDGDLAVYVTPPDTTPVPEDDIQPLNVAYTVTQNIDPITGGFITFLPGYIPANGAVVTLSRDVQASLDVEFSNAQNFNGANLDAALERLLLLIQQNKTYNLQRNLSYRVNSYLPEIEENTQLQPLLPNYIWMGGQDGGVVAVELEQNPDVSTLRSELANNSPGTDGARLVGYYNTIAGATTVHDFLDNIPAFVNTNSVNTQTYTDTGTPGAVVVAIPATYTAYVNGTYVRVLIANNNPGVATINVNGIGDLPIERPGGASIFTDDMVAGMVAEFVIYTTHAILLNPQTGFSNKWFGAAVSATNSTIPPGNSPVVLNWTGLDANPYGIYGGNRMTPNIVGGGFFLITCTITLPHANNNNHAVQLILRKNGSISALMDMQILTNGDDICLSGSAVEQANGTGDYFEILASNFGIATLNLAASFGASRWTISMLGQ